MTNFVKRTQVSEYEPQRFAVEASELGWPPGHWPESVQTDLGNGQDLIRVASIAQGGGYVYQQSMGCIKLRVLND